MRSPTDTSFSSNRGPMIEWVDRPEPFSEEDFNEEGETFEEFSRHRYEVVSCRKEIWGGDYIRGEFCIKLIGSSGRKYEDEELPMFEDIEFDEVSVPDRKFVKKGVQLDHVTGRRKRRSAGIGTVSFWVIKEWDNKEV